MECCRAGVWWHTELLAPDSGQCDHGSRPMAAQLSFLLAPIGQWSPPGAGPWSSSSSCLLSPNIDLDNVLPKKLVVLLLYADADVDNGCGNAAANDPELLQQQN